MAKRPSASYRVPLSSPASRSWNTLPWTVAPPRGRSSSTACHMWSNSLFWRVNAPSVL